MLISGSCDKQVVLWNAEDGSEQAKVKAHRGYVMDVSLISERLAASAGADGVIKLWNLPELREVHVFSGHDGGVTRVTPCGAGHLLSGGWDGTVQLWDLDSKSEVARLMGHTGRLHGLAASADSKMILSAAEDGRVIVWSR